MSERLIDLIHLARKTKGNAILEKELLDSFERQALVLLEQIKKGENSAILALKETASNIGAQSVLVTLQAYEKGEIKAFEKLEVVTKRTNSFIATLKKAA